MSPDRRSWLLLVIMLILADMPGAAAQVTLPMRYNLASAEPPTSRSWIPRGSSIARDARPAQQSLQDKQAIFTVDVQIGGQATSLQVDTGSADMWVADKDCNNCQSLLQPLYDPTKSGKASGPTGSHSVNYGAGETSSGVSGTLMQDTFSFGNLTLDEYKFTAVNDSKMGGAYNGKANGIFPIGPDKLSTIGGTTPFSAMFKAKLTNSSKVGILVSPDNPSLTLGGVDPGRTADDSGKASLSSQDETHYVVTVDDVLLNGTSLLSGKSRKALIDTGTTYTMGPQDLLAKIYNSIPNGGLHDDEYVLPCEGWDAKLDFVLGGKTFTMGSRNLVGQPIIENGQATTHCFGTLMKNTISNGAITENDWLLGLSFLETVYLSIDTATLDVELWPVDASSLEKIQPGNA